MSETKVDPRPPSAFDGYYRKQSAEPDRYLCDVERGTPGGEYLRRFWHPVAYLSELTNVPLRVRALGEDLVAFRDGRGEVGVLHLRCCHRNTSLEFGVVEDRGIRCCYHGRLFDTDGTLLELPGDPAAERLRTEVSQGGYPTHVFSGIVFTHMGPPERVPVFPHLDRFDVPGMKLVPGDRLVIPCNWIQIKENALDPHHTNILHVIPKRRGMDHFANEFSNFPELAFMETPGGFIYLGARKVGGNLWVRSAETYGPNIHCISSIFETGEVLKDVTTPFMTFWTLPADADHSINFFISHVADEETMPFEKRRALEVFGQTEDRPYAARQLIPGDHDAQVGQGIRAVERGQDPHGFYMTQAEVAPSFANDRVLPISVVKGSVDDPAAIIAAAEQVGRDYLAHPPMATSKTTR